MLCEVAYLEFACAPYHSSSCAGRKLSQVATKPPLRRKPIICGGLCWFSREGTLVDGLRRGAGHRRNVTCMPMFAVSCYLCVDKAMPLRFRDAIVELPCRPYPEPNSSLSVLEGRLVCVPVGHTARKFGDVRYKSVILLAPINDDFILSHRLISAPILQDDFAESPAIG